MQRRASKKTRTANAAERRFLAWTKQQDCIACETEGPVIAHHCYGSTARRKVDGVSVIIGMWAVIPLCQRCDDLVTYGSRRALEAMFGPQITMLRRHMSRYPKPAEFSADVLQAFREMDQEQQARSHGGQYA